MRDAVEKEWPNPIAVEEHEHAGMAAAYAAGASHLPFGILRGYVGTDLPTHNPNISFIECPFTGEKLAAVPAIRPDVTVIHAQKADRKGNVLMWGVVGVQKEAVMAAKRSIVTVEEIVDDLNAPPNRVVLPSWVVGAVCEVKGGAFPSYAQGYYARNNAFYKQWDGDRAGTRHLLAWIERHVMGTKDFDEFRKSMRSEAWSMPDYTADEMMTIAAARMMRNGVLLRRHRSAQRGGEPRASHARARHRTHLRIGLHRHETHMSAPFDRRRRTLRNGRHRGFDHRDLRLLAPGRTHRRGFLGAAQIDRFANINSTVIGAYDKPKTRLPGAGGAPAIAANCGEVLITLRQTKRAFVEKLDFRTSGGHMEGGDSRAHMRFPGKGPTAVITDLGILTPDAETKELTLTSVHPGVTVEASWRLRDGS